MELYINNMIGCDLWIFIENSKNVDEIIEYIPKINIPKYDDYKKFLIELQKHTNTTYDITYNDIITIQLIDKYKSDFLSKTLVDIENLIYKRANEIIKLLKNYNEEKPELIKKLITFKIMFEDWKKKDKKSQLDILSEIFFRYNESLHEFQGAENIDEEKKDLYIQELNMFMNNVLFNMKRLDKNYKDHLFNYKFKNIEFDNNARKYIYNNLVNIFWKNIDYRLRILKDYTVINLIIDSYIDLYMDISNDEDYLDNILELKNKDSIESIYSLVEILIKNTELFDIEPLNCISPIDNEEIIVKNLKIIFKQLELIKQKIL